MPARTKQKEFNMDFKMKAEDADAFGKTWDCEVENGIVPIITGEQDEMQSATIAGFLVRGTVPQLPEAGVPWTQFLTKSLSFGELDFYIRESMQNAGRANYYPEYAIENDQLTMTVGKLEDQVNEL